MHSGTIEQTRQRVFRKCRAPALLGELYNDDGTPFRVEDVDAVVTFGRIMSRRDVSPAATIDAPCSAPYLPHTSGEITSISGTGGGGDTIQSGPGFSDTSIPSSASIAGPPSISLGSAESIPVGYSTGTGLESLTLNTDPIGTINTIEPLSHPQTVTGPVTGVSEGPPFDTYANASSNASIQTIEH